MQMGQSEDFQTIPASSLASSTNSSYNAARLSNRALEMPSHVYCGQTNDSPSHASCICRPNCATKPMSTTSRLCHSRYDLAPSRRSREPRKPSEMRSSCTSTHPSRLSSLSPALQAQREIQIFASKSRPNSSFQRRLKTSLAASVNSTSAWGSQRRVRTSEENATYPAN